MKTADFQLDVREAIEGLYRTFLKYEVTFPLVACPCCFDDGDQDRLSVRPLRELPDQEMGYYVSNAILTVGTIEDFKHFLPRILELCTFQRGSDIDYVIVFERLPYAAWREWPDREQHAIEAFAKSLWRHVLCSPNPAPLVGTCLASIAQAIEDISDFLGFWSFAMDRSSHARRCMAEFLRDDFFLLHGHPLTIHWPSTPDRGNRVVEWMRRSETARQVELALEEWVGTTEGREYAYLPTAYRAWRKRDGNEEAQAKQSE